MAQQIRLEVVTPNGAVVSEDVDIVNAPGYGGDFGVLANHAPFLATIRTGSLTYEQGKKRENLMISGGFCECSNNKITFLVESAEFGRQIDVDRAMKAKERAEPAVQQVVDIGPGPSLDFGLATNQAISEMPSTDDGPLADDNGDGDCSVCTSPAAKQAAEEAKK